MADDGGRRPKRRCATRNAHTAAMPSATHYVGYVEDEETPEMIMAKFLELERIQQAVQEAKDAPEAPVQNTDDKQGEIAAVPIEEDDVHPSQNGQSLTDEQLLQVFKQTSMFNVKTALQDNAMLMGIDEMLGYTAERYGYDEVVSDDDDLLRSFWSDDEDAFLDSDASDTEASGKRGGRRGSGGRRTGGGGGTGSSGVARAQRNAGSIAARHSIVTAYNPETQSLVRRKVRVVDPDEIIQIRVPPTPLPLSWGRTVQPYIPVELQGKRDEAVPAVPPPDEAPTSGYVEISSMAQIEPKTLPVPAYQAALINPGWDVEDSGGGASAALAALSRVPLPKLVPAGFVFIWTPKHHVQAVCKQMAKWGYIYIENLTWVYLGCNNELLKLPSSFVRNSHLTLYMFRCADKGRDIELRHQRNSDVTFECLAAADGGAGVGSAVEAPKETFVAVETLLPTGKGKLLELWAPKGVQRPGWTHVVEVVAQQ